MHFLVLLLQALLDHLVPTWRDGLTMAARADGRIEHIPTRRNWWDRWISWLSRDGLPPRVERGKVRADQSARQRRAAMNRSQER